MLICKRGALIENSTIRRNVDKEFVILFTEFDENKSWLLDDNIENYVNNPGAINTIKSSPEFIASNKIASINGYIYGNLPGLDMKQGDKISWHIIGVGDWNDIHSRKFFFSNFCIVSRTVTQTSFCIAQTGLTLTLTLNLAAMERLSKV